jgi:hypothetical protein
VLADKLEVGGDFVATIIHKYGLSLAEVSEILAARDPGPSRVRVLSNIPLRRKLPFVGRDDLLKQICETLGDPSKGNVVVL